jgi:hypothetical protein
MARDDPESVPVGYLGEISNALESGWTGDQVKSVIGLSIAVWSMLEKFEPADLRHRLDAIVDGVVAVQLVKKRPV